MVSSSVRTMSFLSNQNVSTRKEVSFESKTEDFAKMMDSTINKTQENVADSNIDKNVESKISKTDESSMTTEAKNVKEDTFTEEAEVKDAEVIEEVLPEEELTTEDIKNVLEEILSVVASVLNVTVSKLQNTLEELGIKTDELLDVNNVMKLVMDMENIDNKMELLVHEDANAMIKDIQSSIEELVENIKKETGVDIEKENVLSQEVVEEVTTIIEEVDASKDVMEGENVDNRNTVNVTTQSAEENQQTDSQMTGKETESDSMNDDNAKEASKNELGKTFGNPLNELRENVINEIESALGERVDEAMSARIVREISENISLAIRQSTTSLEMQLYPEHLGKITVVLATEEGGITAKITAETEMAKNAIEQQLTILKENFDKQGLKVTDIEVTIASHGFEQNLDKNNSGNEGQRSERRGIRRDLLNEINGVSDEESEKENIVMQTLGNTVSYLA